LLNHAYSTRLKSRKHAKMSFNRTSVLKNLNNSYNTNI